MKTFLHHLTVGAVALLAGGIASAEDRPIDGLGNNADNPTWGAIDTQLLRYAPSAYSDGVAAPSGADRPNPREISNAVLAQGRDPIWSERVLTTMLIFWGQFIDHDLDLTESAAPFEAFMIPVPTGDTWLDPNSTGTAMIPLLRSIFDHTTGTGVDNPREQINEITSFLDGSMVYGSTQARADALRSFDRGRLKVSENNLLPFNVEGLSNADPFGRPSEELFLAGDVRANEQPMLTAYHTLFVREHNRAAALLEIEFPDWSDEDLYQEARARTSAIIASITFNEYLPALLGEGWMDDSPTYDPTVNPGIANEFSTAAYRFGHSQVNPLLLRVHDNGAEIAEGHLDLFDAFFQPSTIIDEGGIEPLLRGAMMQQSQEIDSQIVDDLRNLLFPAGSGGIDLGAVNMQRGRDHGLPSYTAVREALGLSEVTSFADINPDADVQARLSSVYDNVDQVDLWLGGLAETHVPGGSLGETFATIISDQFNRVRAGDRFWYTWNLPADTVAEVESTSLAEVIRRNTSISYVQDSVFFLSADTNRDADLDFFDVLVFLQWVQNGDVRSDVNSDGQIDAFDVIAFLGAFSR